MSRLIAECAEPVGDSRHSICVVDRFTVVRPEFVNTDAGHLAW